MYLSNTLNFSQGAVMDLGLMIAYAFLRLALNNVFRSYLVQYGFSTGLKSFGRCYTSHDRNNKALVKVNNIP